MHVKPAEGLKIRDPFKKDHLPVEGREVPDDDLYWHRCVMSGDVVIVPVASAPASLPEESMTQSPSKKTSRSTLPTDRSTEQ